MSETEILKAFKALKLDYKGILNKWLSENIKKGVKYTYLVRPETVDVEGYTHLDERIYCPPKTIKEDGEFTEVYDFLPVLSIRKMNALFKKAGYEAPNWEHLSKNYTAMDRLVDYINEEYRRKHGIS